MTKQTSVVFKERGFKIDIFSHVSQDFEEKEKFVLRNSYSHSLNNSFSNFTSLICQTELLSKYLTRFIQKVRDNTNFTLCFY